MEQVNLSKPSIQTVTYSEFQALKLKLSHQPMSFVVATDSMSPLIPVGAQIEVANINEITELAKFDIIVFWDGTKLVSHMVRHINRLSAHGDESTVTTQPLRKGEDLPVPFSRVLGRITNYRISIWTKLRLIFDGRGKA